jgi:hypothetical protein
MAESLNVKPPAWLEFLVSRLVPPACREHVLGDFAERYTSAPQYAADALRTLPFVIAGQIRRTWDSLSLLMCVIPAFVFFGGLVSRSDAVDSVTWLRALAPTIGVATAVILRSAYRGPDGGSSRRAVVDATVAVACVLLSQAALAAIYPLWVLAPPAALGGSIGTFVTVFVLRSATSGSHLHPALSTNDLTSVDGFSRDVQQFERRIRERNRREVLAGLIVVVAFGVFLWRGPELVNRIGCGLAIAGALFIIYRIRTRGVAHPVPTNVALSAAMAIYQRELERQRDLLLTVTWWYLLPLLPGMVVLTLLQGFMRSQPGPALRVFSFVLVIGALTRQLNRRAAGTLQQKIDRLTAALEKQK